MGHLTGTDRGRSRCGTPDTLGARGRRREWDRAALQEGWVIANHILVSFHVAFISSVLALPPEAILKWEVLRFIFVSPETLVSAVFVYVTFHLCISLHEMGHFLTAARLNALNENVLVDVKRRMSRAAPLRWLYYLGLILRIPYGSASGIRREGLNYYPDAPYNLAVAAAGPRASRNTAIVTLPPAIALIAFGLVGGQPWAIYAGRLLLGIGLVSFLDFQLADPGKYAAFRERERLAGEKAKAVGTVSGWLAKAPQMKRRMLDGRMQQGTHPRLGAVTAPWQFRNCGMGGRHTEKEYPESNISMQEAMFLILQSDSYRDAQELTVRLQNRLKEIIEKEEGCRVMGIGLEGGLAPYIEKGDYPLPEVRLWAMMRRAIMECGCRPGEDVAIALDPALSELELAYRAEMNVPDSVGTYLFWRDKSKTVLDRDGILEIYANAIERDEIPILSIEDGFSEFDHEGWRLIEARLGERIFIIGDDLVTTNDRTIEEAADQGLINCALIKANQIGSLYETLLAMLVALGKDLELVVSHRSKSPNDDMEAHIALAVNALGLKAGGGANTERLVKYQAVTELLLKLDEAEEAGGLRKGEQALIRRIRAYEEPTNAGIPTVGATAEVSLASAGVSLVLKGATPLGTSAGSGEAIHLVDATIEYAEHKELIDRHPALFKDTELGVYSFKKGIDEQRVRAEGDDELTALFHRTQRYGGKGCLNAVDNAIRIIAPYFEGKDAATLTLLELDRGLLHLEVRTARRRGKLADDADEETRIRTMQRKQNIGMNAMLSVSLAIGRAIARVQGKELYELMREEMLSIVDRAAKHYGVTVSGSRFADYVAALREVAQLVDEEGKALHEVLRAITGVYLEPGTEPRPLPVARRRRAPAAPAPGESESAKTTSPSAPETARRVLDGIAQELGEPYKADVHHGLHHARDLLARAERLSSDLGLEERVDWRVLSAAIGLHDVGAEAQQHGERSAARAREVLPQLPDFTEQAVKRVASAIVLHEDRTPEGVTRREQEGLEAQLLYDVDQLDAFGPKGVYRYVAVYTQRKKPLDRVRDDARARFETLAFDATRKLAEAEYGFTVDFFERLEREGATKEEDAGAAGVVRLIREHVDQHPTRIAEKALEALAKREGNGGGDLRFAIEYFEALRAAYASAAPAESRAAARDEPTKAGSAARDARHAAGAEGESGALAEDEIVALARLDTALYSALLAGPDPDLQTALREYRGAKGELGGHERPFGIVNNRLFRAGDQLVAPYLFGTTVELHVVAKDAATRTMRRRWPPGTIFTDSLMLKLAGVEGTPIDLEGPLYLFDPAQTPVFQIVRIRDAAALLERVNKTTNRNQAVFWLRSLAARLCNLSVKDFLGAKNLQPEIRELTAQLAQFLNSPLRKRLPILSRLIVRNLSSLVGKPNVIDRLWNDTIDLAEIHIPGSAIVNELRRTSHHALGKKTLLIAQAYHAYLDTGATYGLASLGFGSPSKADQEARGRQDLIEILDRVVEDLQRLLGTSQIVTRIEEWKDAYAEALLRCEFGSSIEEELATIEREGIRERNRWVYYHHLRILASKVESFRWPDGLGNELSSRIAAAMQLKPDESAFDAETTLAGLTASVESFVLKVREIHQDPMFASLDEAISLHRDGRFFEAFEKTRALRSDLVEMIDQGGFAEQRYYLSQLECLLEEMGYLSVRHIATLYQERAVDIEQCIQVIRLSALNLRFGGLFSQELNDFAAMLADPTRTDAELLNVLENIERVYHRIRQRVTVPYEKMKDRLALEPNDLRLILANMQRYMHDLNSMVHFADIAATHIRERVAAGHPVRPSRPETSEQVVDPVLHISRWKEIAARIEDSEGGSSLRDRYGAKGSGLLYINYLHIPTRDGFILPASYARSGLIEREPARLRRDIAANLEVLEQDIEARDGAPKHFGGGNHPLVLAVRGGSVFSMPGILATVVFVGMNDAIAEKLAEDGPWRAYDSYRRFLASYASSVWDVELEDQGLVDKAKQRYGVRYKHDLPWEAMKEVAEDSKRILRELGHGDQLDAILADPFEQLVGAVNAVFGSWSAETSRRFRDIKGICHSWNTAVIVQEMAFGNRSNDAIGPGMDETTASLTGVIPRTYPTDAGVRAFEGELKFSAAGDDLVGGMTFSDSFRPIHDLETLMPMLETRLKHAIAKVRRFMGTDQEVEFTVERGVLSVLQTRRAEARFDQATERFLDPGDPATRGLGVRGGGFRGLAAFDDADLEELRAVDTGDRDDVDGVLLVIDNPTPDDIPMIISADGLLTSRGGSTSHAAVAINGIETRDYSGVVSAANLLVHAEQHEASIVDADGEVLHRIRKGDVVSIHGTTGEVYIGSRRRQVTPT